MDRRPFPSNFPLALLSMTIATLNIDWAGKSKGKKEKIETELTRFDFDILILTEAVELDLPAYKFNYKTDALPVQGEYEGVKYGELLNNTGYRAMIYSKYPSVRSFVVSDAFTSLCCVFETPAGPLTIYATIVGTQFKKSPYAETELNNCIRDCTTISKQADHLCLAGDLNTSFAEGEKYFQISNETTRQLRELCKACGIDLTTAGLEENIDHIFLPAKLKGKITKDPWIFIGKDLLSDHQGVAVDLDE